LQSQPPFAFSLASIHLYGFILAVNVCTTIEALWATSGLEVRPGLTYVRLRWLVKNQYSEAFG